MRTLPPRAGDVGGLAAAVGAGDSLAADDVEGAVGDAVLAAADGVVTGVLVQQAGQEPRADIGAVGLIQQAAPGIGVEAADAFAQDGVGVDAFGGDGGKSEEEEGGVVQGLVGGDFEVVLPARGRWFGAAADGAEVGHEAEDALRLLMAQWDRVAVGV